MTVFKTLNIETDKNYDKLRDVRRHIGLTPRHAIAIDELKYYMRPKQACN